MITHYPVPFLTGPAAAGGPGRAGTTSVANPGSWRYDGKRRSRPQVVVSVVISAALHLGLLFGVGHTRKAAPPKVEEKIIALTVAMPDIKDLEEPEPVPSDDRGPAPDMTTLVPMQADLPQLPQPSDFVQQLNFTSLIDKPDFSAMNVSVIPENFRGGRKLAESIGQIFNLSDLDRVPVPVLQPAPIYPHTMRREALTGTVHVEFIVGIDGLVSDAVVVNTTNTGFNEAAVAGVSKWKFRAGMKAGRKVNTRMRVPIVFSVLDEAQ